MSYIRVDEAAHRVGRALHLLGKCDLTEQVIADVEGELRAVEQVERGKPFRPGETSGAPHPRRRRITHRPSQHSQRLGGRRGRLGIPIMIDAPTTLLSQQWVSAMERAGADGFTITTNIDIGIASTTS